MKKALIITYFFPPALSVAGARVFSWATYFKSYGIHPTVVTRHWKGDESKWADLTNFNDRPIDYTRFPEYDIYRLPSEKIRGINFYRRYLSRLKVTSKIFHFVINALGHFNSEANARSAFSDFLLAHLKKNHYDLIIVSSPPLNLIRLAVELKRKFSIPVHIDFRDLWNNNYLKNAYVPSFSTKWIDFFKKIYINKWMKFANSASTVSKPIADYLENAFSREFWVLTNGFDEILYLNKDRKTSENFRVSILGSYYSSQNMDLLINGLLLFIKDKKINEITIFIVGLNVHSVVYDKVLNALPAEMIIKIDRVDANKAAQYVINSEVILHSSWRGFKGIYTTKIFDFIASGNNILMAPGDDDVADALIVETNTGKIAENAEQVAEYLEIWYREWEKSGIITFGGNKELIKKYGRKVIAEKFAFLLKQIFE